MNTISNTLLCAILIGMVMCHAINFMFFLHRKKKRKLQTCLEIKLNGSDGHAKMKLGMDKSGIASEEAFVKIALDFLLWAIDTKEQGLNIATCNEENGEITVVDTSNIFPNYRGIEDESEIPNAEEDEDEDDEPWKKDTPTPA